MEADKVADIKRSYYAIIPANVRYDKRLIPNAKLLYGEITALCNERGYCWASNDYFAELYNVKKETISRWISDLEKYGYIKRSIIFKEGTKQIINRYIFLSQEAIDEKINTPIDEKVKDNNTSFNNTNNKNHMSGKPNKIPFSEIIGYLNESAGKHFKVTQKWKDLIKARWNEGQRFDDFKKVIDVKSEQWLNNQEMNQYLRPATLFGNKFDSYLNEHKPQRNSSISDEIAESQRKIAEAYEQ